MGDKSRGLYPEGKFIVRRQDGSDNTGGKHDGCNYFVLDITHDPHAVPAIHAYSASARRDGYDLLANDLDKLVGVKSSPSDAEQLMELRKLAQDADGLIVKLYDQDAIPTLMQYEVDGLRGRLHKAIRGKD